MIEFRIFFRFVGILEKYLLAVSLCCVSLNHRVFNAPCTSYNERDFIVRVTSELPLKIEMPILPDIKSEI